MMRLNEREEARQELESQGRQRHIVTEKTEPNSLVDSENCRQWNQENWNRDCKWSTTKPSRQWLRSQTYK